MDQPDIQSLAQQTPWSTQAWSDAWYVVRDNFPDQNHADVWKALVALSGWMSPIRVAHALVDAFCA